MDAIMVGKEEFNCHLKLLCSHEKLKRDQGYTSLQSQILKVVEEDLLLYMEQRILDFFASIIGTQWEERFGHLQASKIFIENRKYSASFPDQIKVPAMQLLRDDEFRVRIAAGELLGALCQYFNHGVYKYCQNELIASIKENLERNFPADENKPAEAELLRDAKDIFHDTAGWKCLETSMKGIKCVIEGCQESFLQYLTQDLLDLIFQTLDHTNRFVRETGYYLCSALVRYGVSSTSQSSENFKVFGKQLAEHLKVGLADNWSQVRLAASIATREFFQDICEEDRDQYYAILLPPMCLNRYYLAEGVRLFNQETWKQLVGDKGKELVMKYIGEVIDFYIQQTLSDNHAVREAACHCMAELALKIEPNAVLPHVSKLLSALLVCFKDESWPVRDTACVACGRFVKAFPNESKDSMDELYPLFFTNLSDPIPSVRQGAAMALADIGEAFGIDAINQIFETIKHGLTVVESQPDNADRYESLEKGPATYGVVKLLRGNDMDLHTNKQMYSCGSLAPKMGRGGGGCSNHSFKRESQPWEMTDGCIYALAELSSNKLASKLVIDCLPKLAKAISYKHYTQHFHLLETFCAKLHAIAEGLGKRPFKMYLELFIDGIFDAFVSDNQLTSAAAKDCLISLSSYIGPNILRGRIENYNPIYLKHFDTLQLGMHQHFP
eukprot:gene7320-8138_t